MKILTLCSAGVVRSPALAAVLKFDHGRDALAAGLDRNGVDTLAMLLNWADRIVVMEPDFAQRLPGRFQDSLSVCGVGPDSYGNPFDLRLLGRVHDFAAKWAAAGWPTGFSILYVT